MAEKRKSSRMLETENHLKNSLECRCGLKTTKTEKGGSRQRIFLSICALLFVATGIFYACKKDTVVEPSKSQKVYNNPNFEQIREHLCDGMVALKYLLNNYGQQARDFDQFIDLLRLNRDAMTPIGKELLYEIYTYNSYSESNIRNYYNGKWMAKAFKRDNVDIHLAIDAIRRAIANGNMAEIVYSNMAGYTFFGLLNSEYQSNPLGAQSEGILLTVLYMINNAELTEQLLEYNSSSFDINLLSQKTGINISELITKSYVVNYISYVNYIYDTYSDDNGLTISISDFADILDNGTIALFSNFKNGMELEFRIFYSLDDEIQYDILEVIEEVICKANKPESLKGKWAFNAKVNFAGWQLDHGYISISQYNDKVCKAQQRLIAKNGADVVLGRMRNYCF